MSRKFLTDKELEEIILNDIEFEEGTRVSAGLEDPDSDLSDAESEHTDHDTESEQEFSDGDNIQDNSDETLSGDGDVSNEEASSSSDFYGESRYKWSRNPPTRDRRTPAHNIVTHLPGLKGPAELTNPTTPLQAWQLLFTDKILEPIFESY
nr:unnamed protein product [Callosobruchus chinensis]